jgi:hypothetical protein
LRKNEVGGILINHKAACGFLLILRDMKYGLLLLCMFITCVATHAGIEGQAPRALPAPAPASAVPLPESAPVAPQAPALSVRPSYTYTGPQQLAPEMPQVKHMPRLEKQTRKVLARMHLKPQRIRWWHVTLAGLGVLLLGAIVLTKSKGWALTSANVGINFIRLAGIALILLFVGMIVYGIVTGGNM